MGIFDKIQDTTAAVTSSDKNTTSIGENCTIDGDITFDKTIEIHGKITGTVKIAENFKMDVAEVEEKIASGISNLEGVMLQWAEQKLEKSLKSDW